MIGITCSLYKTCKICGQTKLYHEFASMGKGRRRSYCRSCKNRKDEIRIPSTPYSYDTALLEQSDIEVRVKLPSKKKIKYSVPYKQAILMVKEGMAGIVHGTLIHKLYDKCTFRQMILNRDNYTCTYCGRYGDTIDHVIPKSNGGISSFRNCVCACEECNTKKGTLSPEEYLYYYEPLAGNGILQKQQLEQQLHYVQWLLEKVNEQAVYEQDEVIQNGAEDVLQRIEQLEFVISSIKESVFNYSKLQALIDYTKTSI
ncbi:HNH endonuclease [Bacillus sp. DX4.1]|uniref:HNH endonuclease n=1 Tax=Bacillus sp. DX4.1 TaxID=3055867 RepID=UPI0025A27BA0|nr:HNH endonuclease [Bacillus sp. DX4.1]MDM5187561.1 HNH endonuclease [Bacillus sp. DX4.1]